jgi:large subunit ribosomal protein L1
MAKKPADSGETKAKAGEAPAGESKTAPKEPAAAKEGKKPREPKEPKEPKAKEGKAGEAPAKTKPAAQPKPADSPGAAAPGAAATAGETAPAAPVARGEAKKKGKRCGVPPARGKRLRNLINNLRNKIEKEGPTPLRKAIALVKQMKRSKFDETVEVHMCLGIDLAQPDQLVRGTVSLPHGIGKSVRVLVFCQGDNIAKAKEAGADYAGDEFIKKIQQENWLDFDVALATQDMMGQVSRLGKVLGPRGLMPTPKAGTVITSDVAAAVKEFKAGKVEYRTDKGGNVHAGVGKVSFDEDKLADNISAFVDQVRAARPSGIKGTYVKSITLCSTMSPGVPVSM